MAKFTKIQKVRWATAMEAAKADKVSVNETDYDSGVVIERRQPEVSADYRYAIATGFKSATEARFALAEMYGFEK